MKQFRHILLFLTLVSSTSQAAPNWQKILTPPESPATRAEVEWLTDWRAGLDLAKKENRPLFVALRCLPGKQCAEFDQDVLEGAPQLTWFRQHYDFGDSATFTAVNPQGQTRKITFELK